jgi:hypothetical protein
MGLKNVASINTNALTKRQLNLIVMSKWTLITVYVLVAAANTLLVHKLAYIATETTSGGNINLTDNLHMYTIWALAGIGGIVSIGFICCLCYI